MGLNRTELPHLKPSGPTAGAFLDHALTSNWERSANGARQLLHFLYRELETAEGDHRSIVALEILATALELLEYVGSWASSMLQNQAGRAHQASNRDLDRVFRRLVNPPLPEKDVALLLRLPRSLRRQRRSRDPNRLPTLYRRVLRNGSKVLRDIGRFWLDHVEQVRSFRHLPTLLSIADAVKLSPRPNADRDKILAQLTAFDDVILPYVDCDGREFRYRVIRMAHVRIALAVSEVAVSLLFASFGNVVLKPDSPIAGERLRKIPGVLVGDMSGEDKRMLVEHGEFLIA
jgi:hypothetical protein